MQRFITAVFATAIAAASASAGTIGQIEIGGTNGLTASYIGTGNTDSGTWQERNYNSKLFGSATEGGVAPSTPASFTDSANGITFAAINDGTGGGGLTNNYWQPCSTATCNSPITLTVPVGIADPTAVWTMLNNLWGTPGAQQTTVTFDFTDGGTTVAPLVINLVNAYNNGASGGQIAASIDCVGPSSNTCSTFAGSLGSTPAASSTINGIKVLTGTVFSYAYNTITGTKYAGSSGTLNLDDQGFVFGTATDSLGGLYSKDYLVNVQITESSGAGNTSQTALSAITVVATPEPSTIFLVLAGCGAIGVSRLRRRVS